ncbi:thiamine pyrophosphate enzyme, N-terminal TPP binding domain-containing protein [Crassisporium funariophilum]|nr:thiamine pyrophosphate enzyme, N-terminal TPP binding domain-containing protein [Crassisporium funariophilum]
MYTASTIFLKTLASAGITHAFVNWGSDHPGLLEELERQRVEENGTEVGAAKTNPEVITCPNEMVALSAAQGYAQATGKPAAVIIHVDVGTQALAGAIHNVDRSRTPVLIYAGASPFSSHGEHKGTRNEWIMWLQDIPDQAAIVRQYMRFTGQMSSAATVEQSVKRALQIATSDPKGPVYLWARREVMEEEVNAARVQGVTDMKLWPAVEPTGLSHTATKRIAAALVGSQYPLIITSHIGRNPDSISALLSVATFLAIPIVTSCPAVVSVPFQHPSFAGVTFLSPGTHSPHLSKADVILVIECDLPWIPFNEAPRSDARVFVVDGGDPLRGSMGSWHVGAEMVCRADAGEAMCQIFASVKGITSSEGQEVLGTPEIHERSERLKQEHGALQKSLNEAELSFPAVSSDTASFTVPNLIGVLRRKIRHLTPSNGRETLVLNESISNYAAVWTHLMPEAPGSVISSGGSSLGWALGAAVGACLGGKTGELYEGRGYDLIVVVVGDGSYMFGVPSSAYWMARRYNTPFLTIVLNNGGWKSPKLSMLGVHPSGHGSKVSGALLSVGFGPDSPDFGQIAVAASAGWAWAKRVGDRETMGKESLESVIEKAIRVVLEEKRCAVVDCVLDLI